MPNSSVVGLAGRVFSTSGERKLNPVSFQNTAAPAADNIARAVVLGNGFNEIAIPSGSRGCLIGFDDGSTVTKTLKGVTGDTGILLDPIGWNVLHFGSPPPASFGITTSAADTGHTTYITFF